jgi:hypothetical protein
MDYFGLSTDYMDVLITLVIMAVVFYSICLIGDDPHKRTLREEESSHQDI